MFFLQRMWLFQKPLEKGVSERLWVSQSLKTPREQG